MVDKEKVKELTQKITDAVKETFQEKNFKKYLQLVSMFHSYSLRNTMLILMQRENATRVAGFGTWKKLGRYVKRDEKGIAIIAPSTVTLKKDEIVSVNGDNPITQEIKETKIKFIIKYVYDVSQTDGEPIPEICKELQGNVKNYETIFKAVENICPYKIIFEQIETCSKGYCNSETEKIAIRIGMSDEQIIKTLISEFSYAVLHKVTDKCREQKEIETESIAYIVSGFFGIDTSDYSFDYVSDWSQSLQLEELQKILEDIQMNANQIINRLQEEINSLEKVQSQQLCKPQKLQERLIHATEKSIDIKNEKELNFLEKNLLK